MKWFTKRKNKKDKLVSAEIQKQVEEYLKNLKEKTGTEYVEVTNGNSHTMIFIPGSEKERLDREWREKEREG